MAFSNKKNCTLRRICGDDVPDTGRSVEFHLGSTCRQSCAERYLTHRSHADCHCVLRDTRHD